MKTHEDQDAPKVIAGIFSLYDIEFGVLIDPGSTHSYVCIEHVLDKITSVGRLLYDMHVMSLLKQSVNVNKVYKNFPIVIHDMEFSVDLILGMDWLSKHWALIDCDKKTIVLSYSDKSEVIMVFVLAQCPM